LIGNFVGNTCAGDSDITRSHWQILLSDAYDKKRKVLPSARHSSSAVHFGRLSAALTNGKVSQLSGERWYYLSGTSPVSTCCSSNITNHHS